MQFFLGYKEFTVERPFDQSMMTHFRKRISQEFIMEITEKTFAPKNDNKDNNNNGNQSGGGADEKKAEEKR